MHLLGLAGLDVGRERSLGNHPAGVTSRFAPDGSRLASADASGGFRVWPMAGGTQPLVPSTLQPPRGTLASASTPPGRGSGGARRAAPWCGASTILRTPRPGCSGPRASLRSVRSDSTARPAGLPRAGLLRAGAVVADIAYPRVLKGHTQMVFDLAFTADSRFLASCGFDGARLWPLSSEDGRQRLIALGEGYCCQGIAADATGSAVWWRRSDSGPIWSNPDGAPPRKPRGGPAEVSAAGCSRHPAGLCSRCRWMGAGAWGAPHHRAGVGCDPVVSPARPGQPQLVRGQRHLTRLRG